MIFYIFFSLLILGALFCIYQIARADFSRRIIPDAYLFPLLLLGLVVVTFMPWVCNINESVVGAVFGYLIASVVGMVFEKYAAKNSDVAPIGMGDIKLIAVGGIWLGALGLSIALVGACVFGMLWAWRKKQKYIPFAPFFFIGGFLAFIMLKFLI